MQALCLLQPLSLTGGESQYNTTGTGRDYQNHPELSENAAGTVPGWECAVGNQGVRVRIEVAAFVKGSAERGRRHDLILPTNPPGAA